MKKTLGALLLTVGLVAVPLHAADAAPGDSVRGPACGDIFVDAGYATFGGQVPPTAFATVDTAKPSCDGATYQLLVLDAAGNSLLPDSETGDQATGDGATSQFTLSGTPTGGPQSVCISVQSLTAKGKVIDQAPDTPDAECATGAHFLVDGATGGRPMG
jgi:hypothetical protein